MGLPGKISAWRLPSQSRQRASAPTWCRIVDGATCSTDLCFDAATTLLEALQWPRESIDGLIMVTQTPDYFMPSSSCVLHKRLGLPESCASFDLGLGCSGYA